MLHSKGFFLFIYIFGCFALIFDVSPLYFYSTPILTENVRTCVIIQTTIKKYNCIITGWLMPIIVANNYPDNKL